MGVGAGLYMYDVVVKKFTFAISSPYEALLNTLNFDVLLKAWYVCTSVQLWALSYQITNYYQFTAILTKKSISILFNFYYLVVIVEFIQLCGRKTK